MGAFKLFISHSSKTNENREFRDKICSAITNSNNNIEILVDTYLHLSDEWFPKINEWMMECHAAIILMSDAALKDSNWVKNEAAVLCARRRANKNFILITVPVENTLPHEIDEEVFFNTIRLSEYQLVRSESDDEKIDEVINHLIEVIPKPTPFDEIVTFTSEILNEINVDVLKRVWTELTIQNNENNVDIKFMYADSLSRMLIRQPEHTLQKLREVIEKLASVLKREHARKLFELMKGLWVNSRAASMLELSQRNRISIAINCIEIDGPTGQSYARRSWPFPKEYSLISVGDKRTLGDIEAILIEQLGKAANSPRRKKLRAKRYKYPLFLVFPFQEAEGNNSILPEESLIDDIKSEYPNITILLATGNEIPQYLSYATPLTPLLVDDQEDDQCDHFECVTHYIDNHIPA